MAVVETNRYAAEKNTNSSIFTVTDLETFKVVMILTGNHSLP